MIEYDKKRNGKGGLADEDEIIEHEELGEEIEEGVWLIKYPFKREEGKNRGESSRGSRDGTKTRNGKKRDNLPKFRSDVKITNCVLGLFSKR
ncbi:hypothetical protein CTI12_AA342420 [Artemisia annua]|uniref:Uncharacterized protein n=1 Tax=Artemisia annua TaxID=35608 RepID=A0A2U1MTV2_ARTAN|nr:hypothetical protein CTI12_AA342420 [Artemisia annua]